MLARITCTPSSALAWTGTLRPGLLQAGKGGSPLHAAWHSMAPVGLQQYRHVAGRSMRSLGRTWARAAGRRTWARCSRCLPRVPGDSRAQNGLLTHRSALLQITIDRPHRRNAFTPLTVREMSLCFADARDDPDIGVIVLTGGRVCVSAVKEYKLCSWCAQVELGTLTDCPARTGAHTSATNRNALSGVHHPAGLQAGEQAFCSGGDQDVRGKGGYVGSDGVPRLNVLDLQVYSVIRVCALRVARRRQYQALPQDALAFVTALVLMSDVNNLGIRVQQHSECGMDGVDLLLRRCRYGGCPSRSSLWCGLRSR